MQQLLCMLRNVAEAGTTCRSSCTPITGAVHRSSDSHVLMADNLHPHDPRIVWLSTNFRDPALTRHWLLLYTYGCPYTPIPRRLDCTGL